MKASEVINALVQSGLLATFLGLAVSGIKCAKTFIDTKTAEATAKIQNANIKSAVEHAEDCITTVVTELSQTTVDALKSASADGKLTAEDAATIKATALAKVQSLLSENVTTTISSIYGNAEAWTASKIEAAVKNLKSISTVTASAVTPIVTVDTASSATNASTTSAAGATQV
jgi:hypothetical protein